MREFFDSLMFKDMGSLGEGCLLSICNWIITILIIALIIHFVF